MASYITLGTIAVQISDQQNVATTLLGCLDCGVSVFDRDAHDASHAADDAEGEAVAETH